MHIRKIHNRGLYKDAMFGMEFASIFGESQRASSAFPVEYSNRLAASKKTILAPEMIRLWVGVSGEPRGEGMRNLNTLNGRGIDV